jgi:hypothetical protein
MKKGPFEDGTARKFKGEIEEELSFHVEMRIRELMRAGLTAEAAEEEARRRFGDLRRIEAECREIRRRIDARRAESPVFKSLTWLLIGAGIALHFFGSVGLVRQVGTVLITIGALWRTLIYLRVMVIQAPPEPGLRLNLTLERQRQISSYDGQGRTPVERLLDDEE